MKKNIVHALGMVYLSWGLGVGVASAQVGAPGIGQSGRTGWFSKPRTAPRSFDPRGLGTQPVQRTAYQDPSAGPAPATPVAPDPSTPTAEGPGYAPSAPSTSNTDLSLPAAEREQGGGGPTEATQSAEAAEEKEEEPEPLFLTKLLGIEESPVKIYGWIQNSFTGNTNGRGNGFNFGVNPNYKANEWMGNQYYLVIENPLEQSDEVNFGFRVDNLFGNDWQFNHAHGLFDTSFDPNSFAGYDPAQIYAEVHLPVLTEGGIDVKGGRFYTTLGYEVVPAISRPLLSVPYMFNYGQPFTHFGMLSTFHVSKQINWYNGVVNGWDRWINENYKWNYLGGLSYTSEDGKFSLATNFIIGPNQFPRFLPIGQQIQPTGTPVAPPEFARRRNPGYAGSDRTTFTTVLTYKWTDKLTHVMETDQSFEQNVPFSGPNQTFQNAEWYSFGNWFLYSFNDKLTGVWRSEVFRDDDGVRTGFADNFYEQTLGLIYKPQSWLWIRPEARYDWAQFTKPYNDATRGSQFTIGFDVIVLF